MHAAGNAIAAGLLDGDVLVQHDSTPWIFSPGIDGIVVIAVTGLVARYVLWRTATGVHAERANS